MNNKRNKNHIRQHKKRKKMANTILLPEYYLLVWYDIHQKHHELLHERNVIEPKHFRQNLVLNLFQNQNSNDTILQYEQLLDTQKKIEDKLRTVISQNSVFYWLHIYRRIAPTLSSEIGLRTDKITTLETRAIAEQAIFKYGKLSGKIDVVLSSSIDFEDILGGLLIKILESKCNPETIELYKTSFSQQPQWVLSDFSKNDIAKIYYIEGLSYQYWYVSAKLRACGKGTNIKITLQGDLEELRTPEQDTLIKSYDNRCENNNCNHGFPSNVGTFVRSGSVNQEDTIFFATPNVQQLRANDLHLNKLDPDFKPNYIPAGFSSREYWQAHSYLAERFEDMVGFGLLEFCQVSQILSTIIMSLFSSMVSDLSNTDLYFYVKFQRGYLFCEESFDNLKKSIVKEIEKQINEEKIEPSKAVCQVHKIFDFLTLDITKQNKISLWSFGPRFIFIQYGENYFCDYSAWHAIFRNLFFGLKNYDPKSRKGTEFEQTFAELAKQKSFEVVALSKTIVAKHLEREIDVAIRINNKLYFFECVAPEMPLDFINGKQKTIANRIDRLQEKIDQVNTLVEFIKNNIKGDNYDFSWATEFHGIVVSPYTEWIWSLNKSYWTNTKGFPIVMSVNEALAYLAICSASG
jgi:hypothetical protein